MVLRSRLLVLVIILLSHQLCNGQITGMASNNKYIEFGLSQSSSLTTTGINTGILFQATYSRNVFYAGPQLSLTHSYFPDKIMWGYDAGYKYAILSYKHWTSYIALDYQNSLSKPYDAYGITSNKNNSINQVFIANGLEYKTGWRNSLTLGLYMGVGPVIEKYYDVVEGTKSVTSNISQLVRINIGYNLFRK